MARSSPSIPPGPKPKRGAVRAAGVRQGGSCLKLQVLASSCVALLASCGGSGEEITSAPVPQSSLAAMGLNENGKAAAPASESALALALELPLASATNLLSNAGFENGLAGWTNWGNSSAVTGQSWGGTYSLRVGAAAGGAAQPVATSQFTVGSSYRYSGYAKVGSAPEGVWVGVKITNSAGATLLDTGTRVSTTGYSPFNVGFTFPQGASNLIVYVWKSASSSYVYVDEVVLATTAATTPAPGTGPLVAPGNWVVMGSSTASGAGARTLAWTDALRANYASYSMTLFNIAKGATTTYAGLPASSTPVPNRPAPDPTANVDAALARTPKLLLISYPSNDTSYGFSVDETVRNLLAIRAAAQAGGASVIILGTQPLTLPSAQLALLPQIDARLSAAVAPCFVPVREALAAPDGTLAAQYDSGDALHPNDAGHAVIYSAVAKVINSGECVRVQ